MAPHCFQWKGMEWNCGQPPGAQSECLALFMSVGSKENSKTARFSMPEKIFSMTQN